MCHENSENLNFDTRSRDTDSDRLTTQAFTYSLHCYCTQEKSEQFLSESESLHMKDNTTSPLCETHKGLLGMDTGFQPGEILVMLGAMCVTP